MDERGKSDGPVVPAKPPNNAARVVAEVVEERGPAKGNTASSTHPGRSAGHGAPSGLERVREVARRDKEARFTALLHHVTVARLRAAYRAIRPRAAPGVDGVGWEAYGQDLEANLQDLHRRLHAGSYRARPSRRSYIPKADGRLRPLGIATVTSYCSSCNRVLGSSHGCGAVLVNLCWMAWCLVAPTFFGVVRLGCGVWCAGLRG